MKRVADGLLGLLFPASCAACHHFHERAGALCPSCEAQLQAMSQKAACFKCGAPANEVHAPCPFCLNKGIRPFESVHRLGVFDEPLRGLIHSIKYHRGWPLAEELADKLAQRPDVQRMLKEVDVIVPVPLHRRRQFARGYNQAEVIARVLARRCGASVLRPVVRIRDTPTQTQLTSQQARLENVRHAFALANPRGVTARRLLLVDDVMTSGATLGAVARQLLPLKPASVRALALAVADPRRRGFTRV